MNRLSDVYGRKIYTAEGEYLGLARDVLIDPKAGAIKFLLKADAESILGREGAEVKRFIKANFIPFTKVRALEDIIIVSGKAGGEKE